MWTAKGNNMTQNAKQSELFENLQPTDPQLKPNSQTTAQQLSALIKSARDIMRKDKGLNGELDRIPMLTWIMFLKFLDDMERIRESEAELAGKDFHSLIDEPYRWRDWAADEGGITGDDLINFINLEEANLPDGTKGQGLFHYLRSLRSADGKGREDVIATVFRGIINRMQSGFLLRDVVNKVNSIHFDASEEMHTLSRFYETMLREMRDAAGDSGEFYTPRPVVKFIVAATNLQLGETVLDPASGTGGFLLEAFTHLEKQCQTIADRSALQESTIYGVEAKSMSYLLCQMNLLLHGLENPQIHFGNSLTVKRCNEIGDNDRYDVILTNPPFGGEEEVSVKSYFPANMQTAETALLFLQIIMRRLKRPERNKGKPGRAAVVVPNGTLFDDGVCARIKEELLINFNLHTIVRLPKGVFAPYAKIPTNLLFFDRSHSTKEIWFYEIPLPDGQKNYTKTKPMRFEEFSDCISWFHPIAERQENEYAWKVNVKDVLQYDEEGRITSADLDIKNPNSAEALVHLSPTEIVNSIIYKEQRILELIKEIQAESLTESLKGED
jgi:type I restriction enzyme M protein